MSRSTHRIAATTGLAAAASLAASSAVMGQGANFEDVAIAAGAVAPASPSVVTNGMRFSSPAYMMLQNDRMSMGSNGTTTLWAKLIPVSMTSLDGQPFGLKSVDLGEMNSMFSAQAVRITGFYEGGGSVTLDVVLDGLYDGSGGIDDLETYVFDSSWSNLREVQFMGINVLGPFFTDFVLDNVAMGGAGGDSDGDGVPDDQDACPDSDMRATVHVGDTDTGVANMLFDDGCTMADMIAGAMNGAGNHGQAVSAVTQLANQWKSQGLISGQEKGAITSAAAKE